MCASAANCDQNETDHFVNTSQFENAAVCSDANKDYDNAINYALKSIELKEKSARNRSIALEHMMIAEYYSKKGYGFEDKIREHCNLAEPQMLEEIDKELSRVKPSYTSIYADFGFLTDCYERANDSIKSCDYCLKQNEYEKKAGRGDKLTKCEYYGCPKSTSKLISNESGSSNPSGGFSMWYPVLGALIVLILFVGLFLSKKKK